MAEEIFSASGQTTEVSQSGTVTQSIPSAPTAIPPASQDDLAAFQGNGFAGLNTDQLLGLAGDLRKAGMSEAKITEAFGRSLVANGIMSEEAFAKEFNAGNAAPEDGLPAPVAEYLTSEHQPPAKATEFKMPSPPHGVAYDQKADLQARNWLETAGFSEGVGSSIAGEVAAVARSTGSMSEPERELWKREQAILTDRVLGPTAAAKIALARQLIRELDARSPGLVEMLESTGAGDSAAVVARIAYHAELLSRRPRAAGK